MPDRPDPAPRRGAAPGAPDAAEAGLRQVTGAMVDAEERPQQQQMTRAVARSLDSGHHLIVQAGTGTGKSLAYLVPAVLSGKKVVVATATKALQDQLADKDLPQVAAALDHPFTFAVLKGRSNYLCRQRALEVAGRGSPADPEGLPASVAQDLFGEVADPVATAVTRRGGRARMDAARAASPRSRRAAPPPGRSAEEEDAGGLADQVRRLLRWADDSPTGDRAELPFEPSERAWATLSVGPRECPGAFRCPSGPTCFAEAARAAAAAADVVVVNTHLYGAHLASGSAVLPPHDVVIFDEAHELEEVMTSSLGVTLTPGRLRAAGALARPLLSDERGADAVDGLATVADHLQAELEGRIGERVLRNVAPGTPAGPAADRSLADVLELATGRVEALATQLRRGDRDRDEPDSGADTARRARAVSAAGHLSDDLAALAGRSDDEVAWVDGTARAPVLALSPIDVGPPLAAMLWEEVTAVLTSATLPANLAGRLGLSRLPVDELDVGSPFDYREHSLLYVARHLPDRRRPESEAALHDELEALITAAGGRTLALFTSRRATDLAHKALGDRLPYRLLVQGSLPKRRILEEFAADETSCLFATLGFWQGVDIPGRSLSLVTLDRLPFARPDEPLLEARRERAGDEAFRLIDLPRAAMLLAQGAGRLIRSADDRGVVAVLDPRLATAGYRAALLAGVPPMRRTTDRRQVEDFLARILSTEPTGQ